MALVTQIRLPSITGSMGLNSGDVQKANFNSAGELNDLSGTGISSILQQFANAIGKLSGESDWTNSTKGVIKSPLLGAAYPILIHQPQPGQDLQLQSSASLSIKKKGQGDALVIRTGDGDGIGASGGIDILSSQILTLSASNQGNNAIKLDATLGGILGSADKAIRFHSVDQGVTLVASGTNSGIKLESATPNSSFMLSASLGVSDFNTGVNSTVDVVTKRGIAFHTSGSFAGVMSTWGRVGPQQEGDNSLFVVLGEQKSVRIGAEDDAYGLGGKLILSGAKDIFLSDAQSWTQNINQGYGRGSWRVSKDTEFADFVAQSVFDVNTTLVGALNSLADSIAETEGSVHRKQVGLAGHGPNSNVDVGNADAGTPATLIGYKTNTVQVMLNGQLLVSASGADGGNVPTNGDYYILGNGGGNILKFGFALEVDDQIQVWNLA